MREAIDPVWDWRIPRLYGSVPTAFGAPFAPTAEEQAGAALALLGIPWNAPLNGTRRDMAASNFEGTSLTPHEFRRNSLKYGGYLPELDVDVFKALPLVDAGDAIVSTADIGMSLRNVADSVERIAENGLIPVTIGGNSGPGSYSVIEGLARAAGGPLRVLHLDAHSDCRPIDIEKDTPTNPEWGGTWVWRLLHSPYATGAAYFHFGLRGPRNHPDTFRWLDEAHVPREHVTTYRELRAARRSGDVTGWLASLADSIAGEGEKVWVGVDVDVLDLGTTLDFGDECLGPTVPELAELFNLLGTRLGTERLAGVSIMAMPPKAQTVHVAIIYLLLYLFAGVAGRAL